MKLHLGIVLKSGSTDLFKSLGRAQDFGSRPQTSREPSTDQAVDSTCKGGDPINSVVVDRTPDLIDIFGM